jgi:AraC-like DNA-binding protein
MVTTYKEKITMRGGKVSELAVEYILTRNFVDLKELTVEKIAKAIGVNRFHLSLKFMIDQRITVPNFIMRVKLHEAFFIIEKDKKKSIEELSKELGFLKVEDFDVEFEKYYGVKAVRLRKIKNGTSC